MNPRFLKILFFLQILYSILAQGQPVTDESVLHEFSFCLVCHGYQGQGNTTVLAPPLVGIEPWYFSSALADYRAGARHTSPKALEMQAAVRMLDVADESEVVALLAQFPQLKGQSVTASPEKLERGAQGYAQYCAACHGLEAEGNQALAAPGLARLSDWYLHSAWQAFLEGNRGDSDASPTALQMRQLSLSLQEQVNIEDVIAYINDIN